MKPLRTDGSGNCHCNSNHLPRGTAACTRANVVHNQELLSAVIFHPVGKELVASAQGVLQVHTLLLPPAQLAINGHCLQLQQAGQGPNKLLMEVPSRVWRQSSQKRLHCHGRTRSAKACRTSKQSVSSQWTQKHQYKGGWIWLFLPKLSLFHFALLLPENCRNVCQWEYKGAEYSAEMFSLCEVRVGQDHKHPALHHVLFQKKISLSHPSDGI